MYSVHIEHAVRSFDGWRAAFDSDPVGREKSGVKSYRISRPTDDPLFVIVDLDFETAESAEKFLTSMQQVWTSVQGSLITGPLARISEVIETKEY